ncbi:tripartite tricarboxylate transporter TctB family protein [Thioclava sp.]|uniref:tripartite tricarboxylate transporter TctB family protein n=1 Tax=Thioclava sp. TaxID=1933450 RepID=UPI003AA9C91B
MKISDRLMGCFLLLFATAVLLQASTFPMIPGQSVGSGLLPTIVAVGLIICAIILITKDLLGTPRPKLIEAGAWITDRRRILRVAIVLLGTASFIPFLDVIGFPVLSITVLLAFLLSLRVEVLTAVLVSVTASLAIHTLFSKVFLVPLPWGVLQSIAW